MADLTLTEKQIFERLVEPQRSELLKLAVNEDVSKVFPIHFEGRSQSEIDKDMVELLKQLISKWLFRAVDLAYNENLDSQGTEGQNIRPTDSESP